MERRRTLMPFVVLEPLLDFHRDLFLMLVYQLPLANRIHLEKAGSDDLFCSPKEQRPTQNRSMQTRLRYLPSFERTKAANLVSRYLVLTKHKAHVNIGEQTVVRRDKNMIFKKIARRTNLLLLRDLLRKHRQHHSYQQECCCNLSPQDWSAYRSSLQLHEQ